MIELVRAILVSIRDSEEELLFKELMNTLNKHGVTLQGYTEKDEPLKIHDLQLKPSNLCVLKNGEPLEFTYREFYLLYHLAKYPGMVFSKEHLYEVLWHEYSFPKTTSSTVSALVSKVRKKLNKSGIEYIQTVRDVGYRFNPELK